MSEATRAPDPVLITFPPSLDSELGRFLLEHYGIRHCERPHAFVFCSFVTLWHTGSPIFPALYSESFKLVGPRAMADYFDARCPQDVQLWPQEESQRRQGESDWSLFNESLAFATAIFAYYHLLPHRDQMIRPLTSGTPDFERKTVEFAYPVFAGVLSTLLWLTPKRAQENLNRIRTIFDGVDARLGTGARFLVGDRLSLSDLAFSVAAAPVVLPPAYADRLPSLAEMPAELQSVVNEMRARAAGAFALRIYEQHRFRSNTKPV